MSLKTKAILILAGIVVFFTFLLSGKIIENNRAGYYQVKQAFITGSLTARLIPGWYGQWFGAVSEYKAVATIGFGEEEEGEGSADLEAIPVMFNDGSKAEISGLVRIKLPQTTEELISLKKEYAGGHEHFIRSGVVPNVTNAVKLSANLRSAQDAYTTLALFQQAIQDQLMNGIYKTRSEVREVERATGDIEKIRLTEIVTDEKGEPIRVSNRFKELGCEVTECVISIPKFDKLVEDMIAKRKEEAMKTELAKQAAIRAQQDRITIEEQGKADVMKKQYDMEQVKISAVVEARKEKEVAELTAEKELNVAKLQKLAASETKQKEILLGEGEATRRRLVMSADGALSLKLQTYENVQKIAWENIGKAGVNWVPQITMGGAEGQRGQGNGATTLIDLLAVKTARDLGIDMGIRKGENDFRNIRPYT